MHGRKGPSQILKKAARQSKLHEARREPDPAATADERVAARETKLEPIVDRRSYDRFLKTIALRIYHEFAQSLRSEGVERPEVSLVGFDLRKTATPSDARMADYVALNARLIVEKAFVDLPEYAARHMPRVMRQVEAGGGELAEHVETKVRRDLVMEIRAFAMQHIPEEERFRHVSKLKEL